MIKNLIEKVDYFWLFFILTIVLCFGFFLTNSSVGIDDELLDWYGSIYSIISIGRLGRMLQWIIGYDYLPFFYDFIAIILYVVGITITADCFMKYIENFCVFSCFIPIYCIFIRIYHCYRSCWYCLFFNCIRSIFFL